MEEKIRYSVSDLSISPVTENDVHSFSEFYCGVEKLDEFFHNEVVLCSKYNYLVPYKCTLNSTGEIVGLFTLANDVLALEHEDRVNFPNLSQEYDHIFCIQSSYPAINIGHLAVRESMQSRGIGSFIVNFVAATFANMRISGCQFITVDAINRLRTTNFYELKLGFNFQTVSDLNADTRRMYLDIFTKPRGE